MRNDNHDSCQPIRELEWLAHYFGEHCREDLAKDIFTQIRGLRQRAQDSLKSDASHVLDFQTRKQPNDGRQA